MGGTRAVKRDLVSDRGRKRFGGKGVLSPAFAHFVEIAGYD